MDGRLVRGVELVELRLVKLIEFIDRKLVAEASLVKGRLDKVVVALHTDVEHSFPD